MHHPSTAAPARLRPILHATPPGNAPVPDASRAGPAPIGAGRSGRPQPARHQQKRGGASGSCRPAASSACCPDPPCVQWGHHTCRGKTWPAMGHTAQAGERAPGLQQAAVQPPSGAAAAKRGGMLRPSCALRGKCCAPHVLFITCSASCALLDAKQLVEQVLVLLPCGAEPGAEPNSKGSGACGGRPCSHDVGARAGARHVISVRRRPGASKPARQSAARPMQATHGRGARGAPQRPSHPHSPPQNPTHAAARGPPRRQPGCRTASGGWQHRSPHPTCCR